MINITFQEAILDDLVEAIDVQLVALREAHDEAEDNATQAEELWTRIQLLEALQEALT
jgi:hypothetical protein